jgi:hypothetical protein
MNFSFLFNRRRGTFDVGGYRDGAKVLMPDDSGRDPIRLASVGRRPGLTPGHYRVRLRFRTPEQARQALAAALVDIENGAAVAHIDVPVVRRDTEWAHEDLPHEIRGDW